jgi:rSAM/selenodomain-associated transferase 2/rSAM/selenodomain-associated transferase 1
MPANHRERLIVFTRYPEVGKTKTRLISSMGADSAAHLQRLMTEHVISKTRRLAAIRKVSVEVYYEGGNEDLMRAWLGPYFAYTPQSRGDLDRRMSCAFEAAFASGIEKVVIIGSDIPGITTDILQQAFDILQNKDLVLGPANDGGYYLIGLQNASFRREHPALFTNIPWGTDKVLDKSLNIAAEIGLTFELLTELADVDRPQDLCAWEKVSKIASKPYNSDRLSVIIPTLNEADHIFRTLKTVQQGHNVEAIVVDGGSHDQTVDIAETFQAVVICTPPSRAGQMNAGAAAATGGMLLFLHADTQLPNKFEERVRRTIQKPGVIAGAFELQIDSAVSTFRIIERLANWRSYHLQMPYGDQAIFISAPIFHKLGGFREMPIMEDFELMRRLRRKGQIATIQPPVCTSPRRWLTKGIYRTWFMNQVIIVFYYLGIPPAKLARWYRRGM